MPIIKYKDKYFEIKKSPKKNKQLIAVNVKTKEKVHFGDPNMPEFPNTKRGNRYCARSSGIKGKKNPKSANFWSRKFLWYCKGKESKKSLKEAGLIKIR